ncbi:MAG: hypothetical protein GYB68_19260 [Chloroflexi bacterium]|nr:hypothetical protein [Chloroflexota bacterium]
MKRLRSCHPLLSAIAAWLALSGCITLAVDDAQIAAIPTLTPSRVFTETPGATETPVPPTQLPPTITLTPVGSGTPIVGPTSTPLNANTGTPPPFGVNDPIIEYFVSTPEEARPGEEVLLVWSTLNASNAAVYRVNSNGEPGQTWQVEIEGALTVVLQGNAETEQYVLSVTNGLSTIERVLDVIVSCNLAWFYDPNATEGCPDGDPIQTTIVVQQFERGQMVFMQATGEIFVLLNAAPPTEEADSPLWAVFQDTWVEGEPEDDPNLTPPEGLRQPRRGLGKVWREQPGVQDALGWAISEERAFIGTLQRETLPEEGSFRLAYSDDFGNVTLLDPGGADWRIFAP